MRQKVLLPVEVPVGEFCWDRSTGGTVCEHFDNEGGHSRCTLMSSWYVIDSDEGVFKAPECAKLKIETASITREELMSIITRVAIITRDGELDVVESNCDAIVDKFFGSPD